MKIVKEKLSKETIKQIEQKVILERLVAEFINDAKIPNSAYYMAINGGKIKSNQHKNILTTLKNY